MELFRLLGTIAIDNSGANSAIDKTTDRAEGAHGKIAGAFQKVGSAAVAAGKTIATGLAVGVGAVAALTKSAISGYADYEQLVGGVETLFGTGGKSLEEYAKSVGKTTDEVKHEYVSLLNAQKSVMKNADAAYKTAGLSANEYMETVTSFSAALIKSLDGDTAKAAEKADQAIVDMSDNANKMGSSMESIQNAYQGFAKQNYTMLDNLKLGYGGTKEEMARLLADAQAISGIEYNLDSYADIVDAIHVIQKEMGIAGTTAEEASSTISGSVSSMKSAWSNLVAGLGNENADLSGLIDDFVGSLDTAASNIVERVGVITSRIPSMLQTLVPQLTEMLPGLLTTLLPALIEGAASVLDGVAVALPTLIQVLLEQVPFIVTQIGTALISAVPQLFTVVQQILGQIWEYINTELLNSSSGFRQTLESIFGADTVATMADTFTSVQAAILPMIDAIKNFGGAFAEGIEGTTIFQNAFSVMADGISAIWSNVGAPVIAAITDGINYAADNWEEITSNISACFQMMWDGCQTIWVNIGQPIWDMISFAIGEISSMFSENMPAIMSFFSDAVAGIQDTWEYHLKPVFEAIGNLLNNVVKPAFEFVFKTIIEPIVKTVFGTIKKLWTGTLKPVFDGICDFLTGTFTGNWTKALNGVLGVVTGVFNGIMSAIEVPMGLVKEIISSAIDFIQEKFDFDWKFPDIKLPHFNVSGGEAPWGFGGKGKLPSVSVEWYRKAMDNPMIMTKPTAFGVNANGQLMAGGEAGSEVVSGTDTLMRMIASVVAAQNKGLTTVLYKILEAILAMDSNMGENLREALDGTAVELDNREFMRLVKAVN